VPDEMSATTPPSNRVTVDRTDLFLVLGALAAAIEGKWHPRLDRAWVDLHADARSSS